MLCGWTLSRKTQIYNKVCQIFELLPHAVPNFEIGLLQETFTSLQKAKLSHSSLSIWPTTKTLLFIDLQIIDFENNKSIKSHVDFYSWRGSLQR